MTGKPDICAVKWCVAQQKTDSEGRALSVYCAVHAVSPEAFRQQDLSLAKKGIGDYNRREKREKEKQERAQPLPAKK